MPAKPDLCAPSRLPTGHVLQQRNSRAFGPDCIQSIERGQIPANRLRAENLWQAHGVKDSMRPEVKNSRIQGVKKLGIHNSTFFRLSDYFGGHCFLTFQTRLLPP